MTIERHQLRYFVDESLLGLGKTLAAARRDVIHTNHPVVEREVPLGCLDTVWIPVVAKMSLIAITHDRHIRTRPSERDLIVEYGLRVVRIESKRDLST